MLIIHSYDDVKPGLFHIASVLVGTLYYNLLSRLSLNAVDILFWSVQQYGRNKTGPNLLVVVAYVVPVD